VNFDFFSISSTIFYTFPFMMSSSALENSI